jgi:hypothetical protein
VQNEQSYDLVGRKLFVAIPAYDFKVPVKMLGSLIHFDRMCGSHGIGFELGTISGCSVVSRARNLLASDFLASSCDTMLFIDADMTFDPNDILRLLAWSSDSKRNIVGGVGCARKKQATYYSHLDKDEEGNLLMDRMGLVRAKRMGTGFMMIQRQVIETLANAHPEWQYYDASADRTLHSLFDFQSTPEGYIGEDYLFCDRARAHGFEVWIDPTIKLGHMGMHEFEGAFGDDILYPMIDAARKREEEEPLRIAYG